MLLHSCSFLPIAKRGAAAAFKERVRNKKRFTEEEEQELERGKRDFVRFYPPPSRLRGLFFLPVFGVLSGGRERAPDPSPVPLE